jgi:hypothetical protein
MSTRLENEWHNANWASFYGWIQFANCRFIGKLIKYANGNWKKKKKEKKKKGKWHMRGWGSSYTQSHF